MFKWLRKKGQILALSLNQRPQWTPRSYDQLAKEGYQKNVIVYRCVNLIAKGCGSIQWELCQRRKRIKSHALLRLMQHPNFQQSGAAFVETVVAFLLLSGNSYIQVMHDEDGIPIEMFPLRPDRVRIIPGENGEAEAYEYQLNNHKIVIPRRSKSVSVIHMKHFHPLNDWYGFSPIEVAASSIDQHNAVGAHNLSILQNGGRPTGALHWKGADGLMTEEQRDSLRKSLDAAYTGTGNAGKILVLEGDFEWKEMGLSPKDLDFAAGKNMSAREIAQAYGVPPILVGVPGDATYSNYKEARFHLWEDTILPLVDFVQAELNAALGRYWGYAVRLQYDHEAIPALAPRRESAWKKIIDANFLTINEKREAVGYPPIGGKDEL